MRVTIEDSPDDGTIVSVRLENGDQVGAFKPAGDQEIHKAYIERMIRLCAKELAEEDADRHVAKMVRQMSIDSAGKSFRRCAACGTRMEPSESHGRGEHGELLFYCREDFQNTQDRMFPCWRCNVTTVHSWQPLPEIGPGWRCAGCGEISSDPKAHPLGDCECRSWARTGTSPVEHHPDCERMEDGSRE